MLTFAPNSQQLLNNSLDSLFDLSKQPISIDIDNSGINMVAGQNSGSGALFYKRENAGEWNPSNVRQGTFSFEPNNLYTIMDSSASLTFVAFQNALKITNIDSESDVITIVGGASAGIYKYYNSQYRNSLGNVVNAPALAKGNSFSIDTFKTGDQTLVTKKNYIIESISGDTIPINDLFSSDISNNTNGTNVLKITENKPDYDNKYFKYSGVDSISSETWQYLNTDQKLEKVGVRFGMSDFFIHDGSGNKDTTGTTTSLIVLNVGGSLGHDDIKNYGENDVGIFGYPTTSSAFGTWVFGTDSSGRSGEFDIANYDVHRFKITSIEFDCHNNNTINHPTTLFLTYVSGDLLDASSGGTSIADGTVLRTIDWSGINVPSSNSNTVAIGDYWLNDEGSAKFKFSWSGNRVGGDGNAETSIDNIKANGYSAGNHPDTWSATNPAGQNVNISNAVLKSNILQNPILDRIGHDNKVVFDAGSADIPFNVILNDTKISRDILTMNTNGIKLLDMNYNDYYSHTDTSFSMASSEGVGTRYVDIQSGGAILDDEDGNVAIAGHTGGGEGGGACIIGLKNAKTQIYDVGGGGDVGGGVRVQSGFAYVIDSHTVHGNTVWSLGSDGDGITSHVASNDSSGNYKLNYFVDDVQAGEQFGSCVDITDNGEFVLVGGPGHDSNALTDNGRCLFLARYSVGVGDISNSSGNLWLGGPWSWRPFAPEIVGGGGNHAVGTSAKFAKNGSRVVVAISGADCARVYDASYLFTDLNNGDVWQAGGGKTYSHGPDRLGNSHPIMWKNVWKDGSESWMSNATTISSVGDGIVTLVNGKQFVNPVIEWEQVGGDLSLNGCKNVACDASGEIVVLGNELYNSGMGNAAVYKVGNDGESWSRVGSEVTGVVQGELLGKSVSVDRYGNFVAIGVPHKDTAVGGTSWNIDSCGNVLVYKIDGLSLVPTNKSARGSALGDELGWSTVIHASEGVHDISEVELFSLAYNGSVNTGSADNNDPATDGKQYIHHFNMVFSATTPVISGPTLTDSATPTVTGTGHLGATIEIKKVSDNSVIGSGTVDSNGDFAVTLNTNSITEGNNNVYADNFGIVSANFTIALDTIPVLKFISSGTSVLTISTGTMEDSILSISGDLLDIPSDVNIATIRSDPSNVDTTTYGDKNVIYYAEDMYNNVLTDSNANVNAVMTFRIVPDFVIPVITSPAIINTSTPTIVGTGTRDVSFVILDDSDISLAQGTVSNAGTVSVVTSVLNEGTHDIRLRTIYAGAGGIDVVNTSAVFSVTIDITSPVLNFSNGTNTIAVFTGEGATFDTKQTALFSLPVDLSGRSLVGSGLTANIATIDANTVGSYNVSYTGVDNAYNALIDSIGQTPAVLVYNVVDIVDPIGITATYDGGDVLLSWNIITQADNVDAFVRFEVLTDAGNPVSIAGNNIRNYAEIANTNMGVPVTYTVRTVVDGATGEIAGSGTDVTITPTAISLEQNRGGKKTVVNEGNKDLTNEQRNRIFKNVFAKNSLPRSQKRVLVNKSELKFLPSKTNYARIKDDVIVLPPESGADTDIIDVNRIDLSNKTLYSALEVNDVLKLRFIGKPDIYKFTQTTNTQMEIKEYANDVALAGDSHRSVTTKNDGDEFEIPFINVIITIGSIVVTAGNIPCLTKGTLVKTPMGFIKVEKLSIGDKVVTHDKRVVPITGLIRNNIISTVSNTPYIIPTDFFGKNIPRREFTISPNHAVCADNDGESWFIPAHHGDKLSRVDVGERVSYFHVELPNWLIDNMVIGGNIIVESHADAYHKRLELTNPMYDELKNGLYRRAYSVYAHQERVIKQKKEKEKEKEKERARVRKQKLERDRLRL
jgi:hypothetical protein